MRRIATATGVVSVLVLLTAGCAQDGADTEAKAQPGNKPELSTSTPKPGDSGSAHEHSAPKGATEVPTQQIDTQALPQTYPKQVWTQQKGNTVVAYGEEGGCDTIKLKVASENAKQVNLEFVEKPAKQGTMCTMQLKQSPLSVKLDQPLGDRRVVLDKTTLK